MGRLIPTIVVVAGFSCHYGLGLTTNSPVPLATLDASRAQTLALEYLKDRYPYVDPSRFVYQNLSLTHSRWQSEGSIMVVFADRTSQKRWVSKPNTKQQSFLETYGTQYFVRLTLTGELLDIYQHDRDDDILKITPAPDFPVPFRRFAPPDARTNGTIRVPPDSRSP